MNKMIVIVCKECGCKFVVEEQEKHFYENRGYDLPKRCLSCRKKKANMINK